MQMLEVLFGGIVRFVSLFYLKVPAFVTLIFPIWSFVSIRFVLSAELETIGVRACT